MARAPNFGSEDSGYESCWRQNSAHGCMALYCTVPLTHYILNRLSHTIYWKSPISIYDTSGYEIYIFLHESVALYCTEPLTHYILNRLSHTIYWNCSISILGTSGYEIYILLEKKG